MEHYLTSLVGKTSIITTTLARGRSIVVIFRSHTLPDDLNTRRIYVRMQGLSMFFHLLLHSCLLILFLEFLLLLLLKRLILAGQDSMLPLASLPNIFLNLYFREKRVSVPFVTVKI